MKLLPLLIKMSQLSNLSSKVQEDVLLNIVVTNINALPVIVEHDNRCNKRLSQACRKGYHGVLEQGLLYNVVLVIPHWVICRVDPQLPGHFIKSCLSKLGLNLRG